MLAGGNAASEQLLTPRGMLEQGLPTITKMVSEAKSAPPGDGTTTTTTTTDLKDDVPAFRPSMALTCVVSLLAIVSASGMLLN